MRTTETVRGQTTLDFGVGMGVFLLTLVFVVAYAPTVFDPVTGRTGSASMAADRAATTLSGDVLAVSTAEPGTLSLGCVTAFFGSSGDCSSSADLADLDAVLSLDGRNANVTIHSLADPASTPASVDGVELTRSNSGSVPTDDAVATRTVSIDGKPYRLTVRVW